MNLLNYFRKTKVFLVPYTFDPEGDVYYAMFMLGKTASEVRDKIFTSAKKYNVDIYILREGIEPIPFSVARTQEQDIRIDFKKGANIDYRLTFVCGDINEICVEPYFIFPYLHEYRGQCGFESLGLAELYDSYRDFFAKKGLFEEAAMCRQKVAELKLEKERNTTK